MGTLVSLALKEFVFGPVISIIELVRAIKFPCQQALSHGGIGDDRDFVFYAIRDRFGLHLTPKEGIWWLQSVDAAVLCGFLKLNPAEVRDADGANLARFFQLVQCAHALCNRNDVAAEAAGRPMDLVEIDAVRAQILERSLTGFHNLGRLQMIGKDFRRDDDLIPLSAEGLSQNSFAVALAVSFRRVKGRDAAVERGLMSGDRLRIVDIGPAGLSSLPATENDRCDFYFRSA